MSKVLSYKIILLIGCIAGSHFVAQAHHRLLEEITKVFPVTENPNLIIDNKHGQIDLKIWEKDSIKIVVEIEVEGRYEHQVEDLMENIEPRFFPGP